MWLRQGLIRPASRGLSRPQVPVRAFVADAKTPPHAPQRSADLQRDSRLAALSGLAYAPPGELAARLQQHGLELQAHGNTHFTRWFVAQGSQSSSAAASAGELGATDRQQQYIFLRGVSWRSADLDALRVWQGLIRALPSPFLPHLTSPPDLLLAHSGVAEMAEELFDVLRPHMEGHTSLHFAGHSLGGSLATLMALTAHLRLGGSTAACSSSVGSSGGSDNNRSRSSSSNTNSQQQQSSAASQGLQVQCVTYGSPPVLAMSQGDDEDGQSILQALRLPLGAVRNYVLQDDPVPRALLSADPAFMALKQTPAVAGLLRLREQWLGKGMLSPTRFLYHPAGDVYLIRWTPEAGHSVRLLAPHTLQEDLRLDVATLRNSPIAMMQALMDHHHGSYASELQAAAAALAKQESVSGASFTAGGSKAG